MINKATFKNLWGKAAGTFKRFPVSSCFMAAAAILAVVLVHSDDKIEGNDSFFLMFWTITSGLLNMAVRLGFTDWRNGDKKSIKPLWVLIINTLWLGICLLFRWYWPLDMSWLNAATTLVWIIVSGIFLAPVWRKSDNDTGLWNHTIDCVTAAFTAFLIGLLLAGGLDLLALAFKMLFGLEIGWKVFADVFWVSMIFIAPMVFMQLIPVKGRYDTDRPGKAGLGLINYLLFPLLGAYVLTLYVYAAKIIFEWNLPRGWVSTLVMASMLCLVLMIFLIYPVQFREDRDKWRFDRKALRLLPAIFLPLLMLMTVGIVKRVSDYGITAPRLYLMLFNVWCYVVCIGLVVNKSKTFRWIPLSFFALAIISSVGPQNFAALSRRVLVNDVKKAMSSISPDIRFPLDSARYSEIMESSDSASVVGIDRKMEYLFIQYHEKVVREIVDTTVGFWNFGSWADRCQADTVAVDDSAFRWLEINTEGALRIPEGYTRFESIYFNGSVPLADTVFVTVSADSVRLAIPMSEVDRARKENGNEPLYFHGNNGVFFTDHISTDNEGDSMRVNLKGIMFLK